MDGFDGVLDAARTGEDWAWRRLYEELAPTVLGYLRGRGASDAEDLTGEVFVGVVRDIGQFAGDEVGFRSWVFTIAHHRLLDDRRRRARHPELPAGDGVLDRQAPDDVAATAVEAVTTEGIRRLIDLLGDEQADVLVLRVVAGMTIDEVARAVGKRPGAVKALQRRGLRALRRMIEGPAVPL